MYTGETKRIIELLTARTSKGNSLMADIIRFSHSNPRFSEAEPVVKARDALTVLHQKLGDEGIYAFTAWAVDSINGFYARSLEIHPLPQPLHEILTTLADEAPETRAAPNMSRRKFIWSAIGAAFTGSAFTYAASEGAKRSGKPVTAEDGRNVALATATGGMIGYTLAKISDPNSFAPSEKSEPESSTPPRSSNEKILWIKEGFQPAPIKKDEKQWSTEEIAQAAAALLKNFVEKECELERKR